MIDFEKIFDDFVTSQKKTFEHDRSKTLGASEVFACLRQSFFKKTNAEKDKDYKESWGATHRGNLLEDHFVVPAMDKFLPEGVDYVGAGDQQKTFVDIKSKLSSTPDGLISGVSMDALLKYGIKDLGADCFVLEIKSVDPRVNLKTEKAIHRGQSIVQLGMINQYTDYKPKYAVILYVDASFLDNISVFVVEFDQGVYDNAKLRADKVFSATKASDLPAEGKILYSCDLCAFTSACAKATESSMPPAQKNYKYGKEDIVSMRELAEKKTDAGRREKEAKEEKDKVNEEIKEFLRQRGIRRVTGDDFSVSYTFVAGRQTVDFEAMREDGIDVDSYKTQGDGFEKVTTTFK
jgi:hypothetical protein